MNFFMFSCTIVCMVMLFTHSFSWDLLGNSPYINRYATSKKDEFVASSSIGYPLQRSIPFSPSMNVIELLHDAVLTRPGSYDTRPKSSSETLICLRSIAFTAPFSIGISYTLPVLLSVTVRDSFCAKPSPLPPKRFYIKNLACH